MLIVRINILIALICFAACERPCPYKCICRRHTVDCKHKGLEVINRPAASARVLDLQENFIDKVPPHTFLHLHKLISLLLNDNYITVIESKAFKGLQGLKFLFLHRNRIQYIDSGAFRELQSLEQLYLQNNYLHEINPETYSNFPQLKKLFLQFNKINRVPPGSFTGLPALHRLRLDSNPLICDCSLQWFKQMVSENKDLFTSATCFEPKEFAGQKIHQMKESDFYCHLPEIMSDPKDTVVNFGDNVTLNCVVVGEPKPKIEWLHDSNVLNPASRRYEIMENGTLILHKVDEGDDGVFECTAKNPVGLVRSKRAKMTVRPIEKSYGKPIFTVRPRDKIVVAGHCTTFKCMARGTPQPRLTWYLNNEKIHLTNRIIKDENGTLHIQGARESDAGLYSCEAKNDVDTITADATLQVTVTPSITVPPKDQTVTVGEDVSFRCEAKGVPKPIITWTSTALSSEDNVTLFDENQVFTLKDASFSNAGKYYCIAENDGGSANRSAVLHVVRPKSQPPKIRFISNDADTYKDMSIQLICDVESYTPARIEWRKNGGHIEINDRVYITFNNFLTIDNLVIADTGRYECSAVNPFGRATKSVFLTVRDRITPGIEYINITLTEAARDIDQAIANTIGQLNSSRSDLNIEKLYALTRFPKEEARKLARGAEIYERTLEKVKDFVQSNRNISSDIPFNFQEEIPAAELDNIAKLSGCIVEINFKNCTNICFNLRFRTIDGSCNNFRNPNWGTSLSPFRRLLPPVYENGFNQPVGWNKNIKYNGHYLPSARLISSTVISTEEITEDSKLTHMVMQWGQWLDHDLDHALPSVSSQTWDGVDCKKTCEYAAPCFPIDVPQGDKRITDRRCIDFIRTSSVCGSGKPSLLFGEIKPREQINQITSFIDASQVYGFEENVANDLRDFTSDIGLLRIGAHKTGQKPQLPTTGLNSMDCRRKDGNVVLKDNERPCFVAGDIRANEQIGLTIMHTIWMREHNRIASDLSFINYLWDGDRIYHETRKIVGAEMQHITYQHWLPLILGPEGYEQLGKYNGYNPKLEPSISNVFATAALRFGHSIINPLLTRFDENFEEVPKGHLNLHETFFAPWTIDEGGVDPLLRGMFMSAAKLKTSTQNLNTELTEKLFHHAHAVALDLAAINIQRGRDHALPPYTKWREFCNMTEVFTFEDLREEISDKTVRDKLQKLYGSVHNIDVWVGGILEDQVEGGKVGPLFRCILVDQFKRLRDGDRFWYENPTTFSRLQMQQIKETTLARILCDNSDQIDFISENVFILPELQGKFVSCKDIPSIDLSYWADCDSCSNYSETDVHETVRSRRATTSKNFNSQQAADYEENLSELQKTQSIMMETIALLKKRVEILESANNTP